MKIPVGSLEIGEEERKAVNEVLDSGRITEGLKVREFEDRFAEFVGTRHCVVVNSGTSALIAGLTALRNLPPTTDTPKGIKVITTPLTYIATSNAIVLTGLEPEYVDIDPTTFGITPDRIAEYLESVKDAEDYSLILPVHLMGYACNMDKINRIAKKYGLDTFEDSSQAHGTVCNGKRTGSMSWLSSFSFFIAHNIQAGEMGAVVTDDGDIAKLIRRIKANGRMCDCRVCTRPKGVCPRRGGSDPRFTHDIVGYNFKVMEFPAAIGLVQLRRADEIIRRRQENVKYFNDGLGKFSGMLQLPPFSRDVSYLAYPVVTSFPNQELRAGLEARGIETRPMFGCIPTQQPAYSHLARKYAGKLPNAEHVGKNGFYIGCHQYLKQDDLEFVVKSFSELLKK